MVEKKDNKNEEIGWVTVTSTLKGYSCPVTKLIEGKEYIFRVTAENKFGCGPSYISEPLIAKNQFGKKRLIYLFIFFVYPYLFLNILLIYLEIIINHDIVAFVIQILLMHQTCQELAKLLQTVLLSHGMSPKTTAALFWATGLRDVKSMANTGTG